MNTLHARSLRRTLTLLIATVCLLGTTQIGAQAAPQTAPSNLSLGLLGSVVNTAAPTIAGEAKVNSTLTASPGTWSPSGATFTYQWLIDGTAVTNASQNNATYTVPGKAIGKKLSVKVVGAKALYTSGSATSAETTAVPELESLVFTKPTISGTAKVGSTLTAEEGPWSPAPITFAYKWYAEGVVIAGATAKTYVPTAADLGKRIQVVVTGSKAGYLNTFVTSTATAAVVPAGVESVVNTNPPVIDGVAKVGERFDVNEGFWSPTGVTFTYQWFADGVAIPNARNTTYTPGTSQAGKKLSIAVTGAKTGYTSLTVTSAESAPIAPLDALGHSQPTITGTAQVASTLTANEGTWTPEGVSFTYQWLAEGVAITGATAKTFSPSTAEIGKRIQVTVIGSKTGYLNTFATSVATAAVVPSTAQPVVNTTAPTITGVAKVGERFDVVNGVWTPEGVSFTYQWLADGVVIPDARNTTYTPGTALAGKKLSVAVTGAKAGYTSTTVTTAESLPLASQNALGYSKPTITGSAKVGSTLTAEEGAWTPSGITFTYKWLAEGVEITGATGKTFVPTTAEVGKRLQVTVTGAKSGFISTRSTSAPTVAVIPATAEPVVNSAAPSITGVAKLGQRLEVNAGIWSPTGVTFTYQWLANGTAIPGATNTAYIPGTNQAGKKLSVAVTGTKVGYSPVTVTTAQTAAVAPLPAMGYQKPTIRGNARTGSTLTGLVGAWTPSGITFTYRWYREGVAIGGATAKTYVPKSKDVGKRLQFRATGTKAGYKTTFSTSKSTAKVVKR